MPPLYYIIKKSPLFKVLVLFIPGIFIADKMAFQSPWLCLVLIFSVFFIIFSWWYCRKYFKERTWIQLFSWLSITLLGFVYTHYVQNFSRHNLNSPNDTYIAKVSSVPILKNNRYDFEVCIYDTLKDAKAQKTIVKLYDTVNFKIKCGNLIAFHSKLSAVSGPDNPGQFDYRKYLHRKNIHFQTFIFDRNSVYILSNHQNIKSIAASVSEHLSHRLESPKLDKKHSDILKAMLLGLKNEVDTKTRESFIDAGIIHILAVSGLHVGMIYFLILGILKIWQSDKKLIQYLQFILSLGMLWCYALITGLSTSVIRATLMFSIFLIGNLLRTKTHSINNLSFAALLILLINPMELFSIGFQFSFLAVGGILLLYPWLSKILVFKSYIIQKFWQMFVLTFSAQFLLIPLQIFYFNQFVPISFITNLFAVPFASVILYSALAMAVLYPFSFVHQTIALVINFLLKIFLLIIEFFGNNFRIPELYINRTELLIITGALLLCIILVLAEKKKVIWGILILSLSFAISKTIAHIQHIQQQKLIVHNIPGSVAISIIIGKTQYVLTDTSVINHKWKQDYYLKGSYHLYGTIKNITLFDLKSALELKHPQLYLKQNEKSTYLMFNDLTCSIQNSFSFDTIIPATDYTILPYGGYSAPKPYNDTQFIISHHFVKNNKKNYPYHNLSTHGSYTLDCK